MTMKIYKSQDWLLALLIINLVSTFVHHTDNFVFFNLYPAPDWMNMHHICIAWLILSFIFYLLAKPLGVLTGLKQL